MQPTDMNVTQMPWQPRLMRLTMIANPEWYDGQPTPCYVNPQLISQLISAASSWAKENTTPTEYHPRVQCTIVRCHGLPDVQVLESPEKIAAMRDAALGYKTELTMRSTYKPHGIVE